MIRPWMPLYVADYLADTAHLSAAEHGAYLLLIMHYWIKGSLPPDEEAIRRITRLTPHQWSKSRDVLRSLFFDEWRHKRIDKELAKAIEKSSINSANAKRSHAGRKQSAERTHTHARASSQSPSFPNGKAARAAPSEEKQLYDRGKSLLGKDAGGLIKRLVTTKGGDIALARSALELASTKSDPREFIGGILRGEQTQRDSFFDPKAGIL